MLLPYICILTALYQKIDIAQIMTSKSQNGELSILIIFTISHIPTLGGFLPNILRITIMGLKPGPKPIAKSTGKPDQRRRDNKDTPGNTPGLKPSKSTGK